MTELEYTWQTEAACRDADLSIFFPITPQDPVVELGKAVCRTCPVRAECLAEAPVHGTFGGMTEWERRALREGVLRRQLGLTG